MSITVKLFSIILIGRRKPQADYEFVRPPYKTIALCNGEVVGVAAIPPPVYKHMELAA